MLVIVRLLIAVTFGLIAVACASQPVNGAQAAPATPAQTKATVPAAPAKTRPAAAVQMRDSTGFQSWVSAFRREAAAQGVSQDTLAAAFDDAEFQPHIIELDRRQPEFNRAIWSYLDSAVSDARVAHGREQLATYADTGLEVAVRYGVPATIIGAIWGVESNYGRNFGNYETIDALATLGYDGRRSDFAENQLFAALKILAKGDIDRERMRGSWAGAMGHTQFLPTSFLAYAVDADGDGRRDIWASIADVMASTANYLKKNGWQRGSPWGREVVLPPGFDYGQATLDTRRSTAAWQSEGVRPVDTRGLPVFQAGSIIAPAGAHGPAFMVGPNFSIILRYNNATSYALAVGLLSDRLAGEPGVQGDWPRMLASMARADVRELQSYLNTLGYGSGTPDGIVGPNTRAGIRAFQRARNMIADGYPTYALLRKVRAAQR